jgi:hypothetical protein
MTSYVTPPVLAKRYAVDVHRVLAWIKAGELRAFNAGDGDRRPRWRISPEEIEAFERRRSSTPEPKITRQRRHAVAVKEYF